MGISNHYVMTVETAAFLPYYDNIGKPGTIVLEEEDYFTVDMSPYKLLDMNLRYYGSSMRGARDGVKAIIGNISMPPVVVNEKQGIYWLPSKSASSEGCIWFGLHFITKCFKDQEDEVYVKMTNGNIVQVDTCLNKMRKRINQTRILKSILEERTEQMCRKPKNLGNLFIKKKHGQLNFTIEDYRSFD